MHSNKIEAYKKKLKLSEDQKDILIGLLLGDACLETQNQGRTYRLRIEYSIKQQEYCWHIFELFKDWVLTPPNEKHKRNGEHRSLNIAFNTLSHGAFRFYAQQFYQSGKKVVPARIDKWLSPKALAYWYMDEGSIKSKESKGVILNTQGFTKREVVDLSDVLKVNFKIDAWERKQKDGYQIYISGKSYETFLETVEKWILPSMKYKIPKVRRT